MSFADQFKINLGASEFDFETKAKNGTLSEERNQDKQKADAAEIITASAGGLDSIANFASLFTGTKPTSQQQTYTPPPPQKQTNPLLIGGIAIGVLLLIALLIKSNNGKSTK